jgi:hypothetical protein
MIELETINLELSDTDIEIILKTAYEEVKHIIEKEREGEHITAEIMNIILY